MFKHWSDTDLLADVQDRLRTAQFTPELFELAEEIVRRLGTFEERKLSYFRALSFVAEIRYYQGRFGEAFELIEDPAKEVVEELSTIGSTVPDVLLFRQKIWLAIHYANTIYQKDDEPSAKRARDVLLLCIAAMKKVAHAASPLFGTTSRVQYSLGQVYRRLQLYAEAEQAFSDSIEQSFKRLENTKVKWSSQRPSDDQIRKEIAFTNYAVGKALALGLGRLYHAQSRLQQALPLLTTAAGLLQDTQDDLHVAYVAMLRGSVHRALAGPADNENELTRLDDAIRMLQDAQRMCHTHAAFNARTSYELALALWARGDTPRAFLEAQKVKEAAREAKNIRWELNSDIVQSMIELKSGRAEHAQALARNAYEHAHDASITACESDALLAHAEALLVLKAYKDARISIGRAISVSGGNPKVIGRCHILQAESFAQEHHIGEAEAAFQRWLSVEKGIEDGMIRARALRVRQLIDEQTKDFLITADENDLRYEYHAARLRKYLLQRASQTSKTDAEIAARLDISRATFYSWRGEKVEASPRSSRSKKSPEN